MLLLLSDWWIWHEVCPGSTITVVPLFMRTKSAQFCANDTKKLFQESVQMTLLGIQVGLGWGGADISHHSSGHFKTSQRAGSNQQSSKVSRLRSHLERFARGKKKRGGGGLTFLFALPFPAHALKLIPKWHSRAAPVLFLGISVSGEATSRICSLLICRYSITAHKERLFSLYLCCPVCVPRMNSHTKPCAVHKKCRISCKFFWSPSPAQPSAVPLSNHSYRNHWLPSFTVHCSSVVLKNALHMLLFADTFTL